MVCKVRDYLSIGVEYVWVVDPLERSAIVYSQKNPQGAVCDILRTENPEIAIPLEDAFNLDA
jgi:Uma2 family endonuclease